MPIFENKELIKNYPRGEKELRQVFSQFSVQDTIDWFLKRGVKLKVEPDGRMFPESNTSETIINCFLQEAQKYNIDINLNEEVLELNSDNVSSSVVENFNLRFDSAQRDNVIVKTSKQTYTADAVICSIGGHNQEKNYALLLMVRVFLW